MPDQLEALELRLEEAHGDSPGPTVPRVVEVVTGNDDADAFVARLVNRIDRVFELAGDRAARRLLPQFESRIRIRYAERATSQAVVLDEARALVDEVLQATRVDLQNRVRTDLAVHLVPILNKEN